MPQTMRVNAPRFRAPALLLLLAATACYDDTNDPVAPSGEDWSGASAGGLSVTAIATVMQYGEGGEYDIPIIPADLTAAGWITGRHKRSDCCHQAFLWKGPGDLVRIGSFYDTSSPTAMNESGVVVGWSDADGANMVPFRWTESEGLEPLGAWGEHEGSAEDVNGAGHIVGFATFPGVSAEHAFLWTEGAGMLDLGVLPGTTTSRALFMNDAGDVVGTSGARGFRWRSGAMQDLGTLGGSATTPTDLGEGGHVVGSSAISGSVTHAFRWITGVMEDLGTLGGQNSSAAAVNSRGDVVGWAQTVDGRTHAFLWTDDAGMVDLGTLGGLESRATDVNNLGEITGWSLDDAGGRRAFVWTEAGGMQELPGMDLMYHGDDPIITGWFINDARQIVGTASGYGLFWDDVTPVTQPVTDAGGPYQTPEHTDFVLDGSDSRSGDGGELSYHWDLDLDGVTDATGPQVTHSYGFPGTFTVRLTTTDAAGFVRSDDATVTVTRTRWPSAVIAVGAGGTLSAVSEGAALHLSSAGSASENGGSLLYRWEFGDGTFAQSRYQDAPFIWNKRYSDDGVYTVRLTVFDETGERDHAETQVVVNNAAPFATALAVPSVVYEGSAFAISLRGSTDSASADRAAGLEFSFDCNNGAGFSAWAALESFTCSSRPDQGTHNVRARIRDKDGGVRVYTVARLTRNHRPVVSAYSWEATGPRTAEISATFSDPGVNDAPWQLIVLWGDGTRTYTRTTSQGTVRASHAYGADGPFEATIYVIDKDRGPASSARTLTIDF